MNKFKQIAVRALLTTLLANINVHAMKRTGEQDPENAPSPKCAYTETKEITWINYAELLNRFYQIKDLSLKDKFDYLYEKVFSPAKTLHHENIYQLWLSWPDGSDFLWSIYPSAQCCRLLISTAGKGAAGIYKEGNLLLKYYINLSQDEEKITKCTTLGISPEGDFSLEGLVNELLYSVQPGFEIIQENSLEPEDFSTLIHRLENQSLIEKMPILNNGPLEKPNQFPLMVELKEDVCLSIRVSLKKYRSNCLSESNFLHADCGITAGSLFYYIITLHAWDYDQGAEQEHASALLQLPLDAGYGDPALPCELYWMQNEKNLSGKEILAFVTILLGALHPKVIYLNDASAKKSDTESIDIRISRPLMCGLTLYAQFAGFQVVDSRDLISHEKLPIIQSAKSYQESLNFLRHYKARNLLDFDFNDQKDKEYLAKLIDEISSDNNSISLGELLASIYRQKLFTELHFVYNIICDFDNTLCSNNQIITSHVSTLDTTFLWKSEAYSKKLKAPLTQ